MAKKLHRELLQKVMNAPVNLYFDVTPVGKLLMNFTGDIGRTDRAFFWHINWVMDSVADCILKIGFAIYFSPYFLIAVVINMCLLYRLQNYTIEGKTSIHNVARKVSKKLHSHFSEAYDGTSIIRAYGKQELFKQQIYKLSNDFLKTQIFEDACHFYFQVRLFFLSNILFVCTGIMCISLRGIYSPIMLAVCFQ